MNKIIAVLSLFSLCVQAEYNGLRKNHDVHENHIHEATVDGENRSLDVARLDAFLEGLTSSRVVIISVHGMVCDFCARGIEKAFKKDKSVKKIDIDLNQGKVLVAYTRNKKIDFADIKKTILSNGIDATKMRILEI